MYEFRPISPRIERMRVAVRDRLIVADVHGHFGFGGVMPVPHAGGGGGFPFLQGPHDAGSHGAISRHGGDILRRHRARAQHAGDGAGQIAYVGFNPHPAGAAV